MVRVWRAGVTELSDRRRLVDFRLRRLSPLGLCLPTEGFWRYLNLPALKDNRALMAIDRGPVVLVRGRVGHTSGHVDVEIRILNRRRVSVGHLADRKSTRLNSSHVRI